MNVISPQTPTGYAIAVQNATAQSAAVRKAPLRSYTKAQARKMEDALLAGMRKEAQKDPQLPHGMTTVDVLFNIMVPGVAVTSVDLSNAVYDKYGVFLDIRSIPAQLCGRVNAGYIRKSKIGRLVAYCRVDEGAAKQIEAEQAKAKPGPKKAGEATLPAKAKAFIKSLPAGVRVTAMQIAVGVGCGHRAAQDSMVKLRDDPSISRIKVGQSYVYSWSTGHD